MSDSDLVSAIFRKYDVVPYVEITNERRGRIVTLPDSDAADTDVATDNENDDNRDPISISTNIGDADDARYPIMLGVRTRDTSRQLNNQLVRLDQFGLPLGLSDYSAIRRWKGRSRGDPVDPQDNVDRTVVPIDSEEQEAPESPENADRQQQDTRRRVVQKAGTSDWAFLKELAKKHGFIVFTFFDYESRSWIGYWGAEENIPQNREYIFRYNAGPQTSLKTFRPSVSSKNQSTEIDLIFNDPVTRRENRLRVNIQAGAQAPASALQEAENPDPIGDGPEVILNVNGERMVVNANHRFTSAEDARRWLLAYWRRYATDFQVIEGQTVIGLPELRARQYHRFLGVLRDSGRYFVSQTRHAFSEEYVTTFTCHRSPTSLEPNSEVVIEAEDMNATAIDPTLETHE
jgi:hypothetical protein